ncbi:MAG: Deoxyguanosinetriphosphate triphosphohydrolase-like protein [Candidatus Peregrinibacteria bacterium GW2011_GWA2_44_7]|nr:MAG: Deoxyguanosinetriphosphate triphosphohydrolase-like protein [Candidatus Peregrinibacteria bacterium GW2011_GWA2_44_7]
MIHDRNHLLTLEDKVLAPYAVKSKDSRGRDYEEIEDVMRTPFQKDRDRIIHCRSFRRLKMKNWPMIWGTPPLDTRGRMPWMRF